MIRDPKSKSDGLLSFLGGQDSSVQPHMLTPDQSSELWNCTVRGGKLRPRPGFDEIDLSFSTDEIEQWFAEQQAQGAIVYISRNGKSTIVMAVGGRFFTVDIMNGGKVQEITTTMQTTVATPFVAPAVGSSVSIHVASGDLVRIGYPIKVEGKTYNVTAKTGTDTLTAVNVDDTPAAPHAVGASVLYLDPNAKDIGITYMIQAEEFLIAQDGFSKAFIFDGGGSRRADPTQGEIPTGTIMAYIIGRVWVAIGIGGDAFVASDIVYGPSGTAAYSYRDAVLKFTENAFISGGGSFNSPGRITAMQSVSSMDTSTGQGPLMVFTEQAVCSVNVPSDREAWALITNSPIQSISLLANGATSFYGTIPTVNGDIFYRALDGMRSFFLARREFGNWGNVPISGEMMNVMDKDAASMLKYHSAIVFDNRLLFTTGSIPTRYGAYWKGLVALDFDNLSNMKGKAPPVYDGTWTGVDPIWIFSGLYGRDERAFMVVRDENGANKLWEISKKHQFDNGDGRIVWTMISRGFTFQNPLEMVRLENMETFQFNVIGDLDITASYRADDYPCWFDWTSQPVCANYRRCESWQNCEMPIAFRGGYKTRLPFGEPLDTDETNDGKPSRLGYVHQIKIQFEGYAEISKIRISAVEVDEEVYPPVDQAERCQEINCCPDDYFEWRSVNATTPGGQSTT